jgi:CysZ protein
MNNPLAGFFYLLAGFGLITKPGLRRYVVLPLITNFLVFLVLFLVLRHFMVVFNQWFEHFLPYWLQWLHWLLWLLFAVSFFLFFLFTFTTLANLIAAPFNSLLAEQVEVYLTGKRSAQRSLLENVKDMPRLIARQWAVLWYFLPRAIGLLLLFIVPVIQLLAAPLWFFFNAWLMTLTYVDYPTDNHQVSYQDMRKWLSQHRPSAIVFGASVLMMSMIPILNLIVMPAAVAGATKFWLAEHEI